MPTQSRTAICKAMVALLSPIGLMGCLEMTELNKVDTSTVYQDYRLTYLEDSAEYEAEATFHVSGPFGNSLELTGGSYVTVNGVTLLRNSIFLGAGVKYTRRWSAATVEVTHNFVWYDKDWRAYKNTVATNSFHVTEMPDSVSLSQGASVTISGMSAQSGGEFTLEIAQSSDNKSTVSTFTGKRVGSDVIVFNHGSGGSSFLSPGQATANIVWTKRTAPTQVTAAGGQMTVRHVSRSNTVKIVP